jgi:hypothetical protein
MRTRTVTRRLLALALAAALPRAAPALEWGAHVGLDYSREDRWVEGSPQTSLPRLELDLGLDAVGSVYSPSTAQWLAMVNWRRLTESNGAVDTTRATLLYQLRLAFFLDPRSPLSVGLQASRTDEDLTADGTSGSSRANTTLLGGDLKLSTPGRPYLNLGYSWLEREETGPLLLGADHRLHTVSASTGHGGANYSYSGRYTGRFSTGTYDFDNYDDHRVDVVAQFTLAENVLGYLNEIYYRRLPDKTANANYAQETNSLFVAVQQVGNARGSQEVDYAYAHALTTAPGFEDRERAEQRLFYSLHHLFVGTPWQARGSVTTVLSEIRAGQVVERATGELLSGQAIWRRQDGADLLELRGGPLLGARQPETGGGEFGWGAIAAATGQHQWGRLLGSLSYDAGYEDDLYAATGWVLRQNLFATLAAPLGEGRASGQFQASAQRRGGGLLGDGASRSLTAVANYTWRRYSANLTAGLASGVTGSASEPIRGDGLFLPAPFDSHSRYLTLGGTALLLDYLWLELRGRLTSTTIPDRADQDEQELFASVKWGYAGIFLSLEDRYLVSTVGTTTVRDNTVMFRIRRDFGSR